MPQSHQDPKAKPEPRTKRRTIPAPYVRAFWLVTMLFALWGLANDITNPMVAAFKNTLLLSNFKSSLVQVAFYGGYCVMAIPAALFVRRFSFKRGLLLGLLLYGLGCLMFVPAGFTMRFGAFLGSYFVMTCGLSFLETTANPYILSMGPEETSTRRLNLAQAFNPLGSLTGMFIAREFILARLDSRNASARSALRETSPELFHQLQQQELGTIMLPYVILGLVVLGVLAVFLLTRLPSGSSGDSSGAEPRKPIAHTLRRLAKNRNYVEGVLAQTFYVGAQIMCWTFIIQYGTNVVGISERTAQGFNIAAMLVFVCSRFACTYALRFVEPGWLLMTLALAGTGLTTGTILLDTPTTDMGGVGLPGIPFHAGLLCLVATSACMSLMFPTIYGIALRGLGEDAKLGAAGLIMAIGGGSLLPAIQGWIMDQNAVSLGPLELASTQISFLPVLVCFVVISAYGFRAARRAATG